MKQQAQRATLLTILAAIYLPLTLVTGIFGMNIVEINEHAPRFWVCIVGLVVIGGATAMGFFGYRYWRRGHQARESAERERENKMYKLA
jgi:Mg2+ and Co2+ transporter CorA